MPHALDTYRQQLAEWARALARAENDALAAHLAQGSTVAQVKLFTDGNLDKRYTKLLTQLEFLKSAWPGETLDELVAQFVKFGPLAAYDTGVSDAERFLAWLAQGQTLSLEQQDYVACQRARHAVEDRARADRLAYVRFMERASVAGELAERLPWDSSLVVQLNPTRSWATFYSRALLDDVADPPQEVVFYGHGGDIATSLLSRRASALVQGLARRGESTIDALCETEGLCERDELVELCQMLAAVGLAALV